MPKCGFCPVPPQQSSCRLVLPTIRAPAARACATHQASAFGGLPGSARTLEPSVVTTPSTSIASLTANVGPDPSGASRRVIQVDIRLNLATPYPQLMPELPEAERARQQIERALNRTIVAVDDADTYVCRPHAPGEIAAALVGRATHQAPCAGASSCGSKPATDRTLGLHLGMAGRIDIDEPPAPGKWDRFSIDFEDGGRLALFDRRRLGRAVIEPDYSHVGPDAGEIGRDAFRVRVGKGTAPLKARLLDQGALSGVGNLLADEVLWQARLSPRRPCNSLSEADLDLLRRELRKAIRSAIRKGGVHTGEFVQERRSGLCPRCGAGLERATIGGRTTYWCPVEQV